MVKIKIAWSKDKDGIWKEGNNTMCGEKYKYLNWKLHIGIIGTLYCAKKFYRNGFPIKRKYLKQLKDKQLLCYDDFFRFIFDISFINSECDQRLYICLFYWNLRCTISVFLLKCYT